MTRRRAARLLGTVATALCVAVPVSAQTFELTVIPPLDTPVGELAFFQAWDINNKGEVAGTAHDGDFRPSAASRYSAARGIEDLDPSGEYRSFAWAISGKGLVFGFIAGGSIFSEDIFLHGKRTGFDFLEKGKTEEIATGFMFGFRSRGALPRSGKLFGSVLSFGAEGTRLVPHIYTKKRGWRDLSGVHPRFADEPTFGAYINEVGHQVFVVPGQPREGEEPPTGRQDVFVRLKTGEIHEVISPGRPVTPGSRPNGRGRMAGLYLTDDAREHAYAFTPESGLVSIHPDGYQESFALGTNRRGAIFGTLKEDQTYADVFVHTEQRGVEVVASRSQLEELAKGRKGTFNGVRAEDMNNKGEIVGCVYMSRGPDFPFLYSPKHGLFDLDAVLRELDPTLRADGCSVLVNDRSQALLDVRGTGRSTAAILKFVG